MNSVKSYCIRVYTHAHARACACARTRTHTGISKSFWTGQLEQELQMVQLSAT